MKIIFSFISISKPMALKFRRACKKTQACSFDFAQGLEQYRNGSRLPPEADPPKAETLSTSPEPVEGLTSKSLDFARDLEPVETAFQVTYS